MSDLAATAGAHTNGVPERCVIVVDEGLPPGLAANAAGVLAITLGSSIPGLVGEEFSDADGSRHAGLIRTVLPVLRAPSSRLSAVRAAALDRAVHVVDFPAFGQQTNDYDEFMARIAQTPAAQLRYLGIALYGCRRDVARLTGSLPLLR
jgi:Protein of unknown function (DUF2000)